MTQVAVKARRGDGVVIGTRHQGYTIPEPGKTKPYDYAAFEIGTVTGITRDGAMRTWRPAWHSDRDRMLEVPWRRTHVLLLPADRFDVAACLATYRGHYWPGRDDGLPKPYESLDEVRAAMRPHLREPGR
jgi:hypothetical protein